MLFYKCIIVFTKWNGYIVYTYDDDVAYQIFLNHCYDGEDGFIEGIFNHTTGEVYHNTQYDITSLYKHGVFHNQDVF